MVKRNDERPTAVRTTHISRRVTVRHVAIRPAEPEPKTNKPQVGPLLSESANDVEPDPARTDKWPRLAWLLLVALVGVLVAGAVIGRQWYDQRQLAALRQQALAAARQGTVDFVSISAATVDADLQRISSHATGDFKAEFAQDMAQVRAAVVENKVASHGTVLRAGLVSASRHTAVVLLAVDATVTNVNAPDGRLSHYRIEVTMALDASGRWLISKLSFVG